MNIVHVLDALNIGGTEQLVLSLCRAAAQNDLNMTLVATGDGELESEFSNSGVNFVRLNRRKPLDWRLVSKLREILADAQAEVIHCHQPVEGLHAWLAARKMKTKKVLTHHAYHADQKNELAKRFLIPRMDANISVSIGMQSKLAQRQKIGSNFHVIYNGVSPEDYPRSRKSLKQELGLSEGDLLLGMVGNFYYEAKDQMTVCKALPEIFRRFPNVHFAFVGARFEPRAYLYDDCVDFCRQANILDRVHFVGKRSDVADILECLDVFVFSSIDDTFGIAAIEAMLMGVPTIVSDIPPLLEVSDHGKYASVFECKNVEQLTIKISDLISSPEDRNKLAKAGKKWAMKNFSVENYIRNLKNLYAAL